MTVRRPLRLGHLYPAQMSIYGDRGNVLCLVRRAAWRGWRLEVVPIDPGPASGQLAATCDGLLFGGGQDRDEARIAGDLVVHAGPAIRDAVAAGRPLLAVCGGYQLLGTRYQSADGATIPGLGLLDLHTVAGRRRAIGNVVIRAGPGLGLADPLLVGFENHSGRTFLGPGLAPLGATEVGEGNNGRDGGEGAAAGSVVATYLHGPILARNPALADWWLARAIDPADPPALAPLDDHLEALARARGIAQARAERSARRRGWWRPGGARR